MMANPVGRPKGLVASMDEDGMPVGYATGKFYMGSRDPKGHQSTRKLQAAFPANIEALLERVVNDPNTPYRTLADLARDAVLHRAYWVAEVYLRDDTITRGLSAHYVREEMERIEARREEIRETVRQLKVNLSRADAADVHKYVKYAELFRDGLEDIEDIAEVNDIIQRYKR